MATQRYSVTPHPIETLLTWVKSGEIAIPEIQRPFVWEPTKVRNLLDSLYQGYPIGYLIAWRNPTVKLKDGTPSAGKRILIDGQQRVTALMAGLLGREVLTKDYETVRIRIAFHPQTEKFEVANPAIRKDVAWIEDVANIFAPDADLIELTEGYAARNPAADRRLVGKVLQKLGKIINNHVGLIELAEDLDIETVTEIFIRVNSAGAELSQADFAMSKIAANETYGGNMLRKAIDYFCHLAVAPDFLGRIEKGDKAFAASEFLPQMRWLKDVNDDIYDPTYTDMLMNRSDVHHIYPRNHLKKQGLARGCYNQIANFVLAQSEINIAIGDKSPEQYFKELAEQCAGGTKKYGGIIDLDELRANLRMSCLPESLLDGEVPAFDEFLEVRRKLMAQKIKSWFEAL
jgi:hypothetical protein